MRDAQPRDLFCRQAGDAPAVETDRTLDLDETRYRSESCGLAGSVGTEHGHDGARLDVHRNAVQSPPRAIRSDHVVQLEQGHSVVLVGPEVGLDDCLIRLHLASRTFYDLATEVEDDDLVGDSHDQNHVVRDDKESQLQLLLDAIAKPAKLRDLGGIEPSGGLVEEQQAGLGDQSPGELDRLKHAKGETLHNATAEAGQPDELQHLLSLSDGPPLSAAESGPAEAGQKEVRRVGGKLVVTAQQDVLQHAHPHAEFDILESPRDAEAHDLVGWYSQQASALEAHIA